jgi:hypothetical protein
MYNRPSIKIFLQYLYFDDWQNIIRRIIRARNIDQQCFSC